MAPKRDSQLGIGCKNVVPCPDNVNQTGSAIEPIERDQTVENRLSNAIESQSNITPIFGFDCVRLRFDCVRLRCFSSEQVGRMFFSAVNVALKWPHSLLLPQPCRGRSSRVSAR